MSDASFSPPPALLEKYKSQLEKRREILIGFLDRCARGQVTQETLAEARNCAHSLGGSGGTYGFPGVSAAGRALEEAIDAGQEPAALIAFVQAAVKSCEEARQPGRRVSPPAPAAITPRAAGIGRKPLLLIADDDAAVTNVLRGLFMRDADIILAHDGVQALETIEEKSPDLVILDDNMPRMTGAEVLRRLPRAPGRRPPRIVMLTANNRMTDIVRGINAGIVDYVTKPFEIGRLASQIRALLRHAAIKILVADDDAAIRDLLREKFRRTGLCFLEAENGEQALQIAGVEKPAFLILDRMMPDMDGLDVLRRIHGNDPSRRAPAIFLTARRQEKDVIEGFDAGAVDYILKPFDADEVLARVMHRLRLDA